MASVTGDRWRESGRVALGITGHVAYSPGAVDGWRRRGGNFWLGAIASLAFPVVAVWTLESRGQLQDGEHPLVGPCPLSSAVMSGGKIILVISCALAATVG